MMNPISNISSIKADIQTAASSIAASVARAWGHAVKFVSPDQTTPAQAKTTASFQAVAEKRQNTPENPIILQGAKPKPLPKPPIKSQNNTAPEVKPKPLPKRPAPPTLASLEKEINNHRMENGLSTHSLRDNVPISKPSSEPHPEVRTVSSEHVEDIPEKVEEQILSILQDIESENTPQVPETKPQVIEKEIHSPQDSSRATLDNLKSLISSLGSKNKLKLNENSELEIKSRSVLSNRDELGTSEKSQAAIENLVGKLIKLSTQDGHSDELLSLANNLKESEWGKEALKNSTVSKNFEILENFLNVKAELKTLTKEFNEIDEKFLTSYTTEIGDQYDAAEQSLKNATWRHDSLKRGINEIIKNLNE